MNGTSFQETVLWNLNGSLSGIANTGIPTGDMTFNTTASGGAILDVSGTGITIGLGSIPIVQDTKSIDYMGNMSHTITPTPSTIVIDAFWGFPSTVYYCTRLPRSPARMPTLQTSCFSKAPWRLARVIFRTPCPGVE